MSMTMKDGRRRSIFATIAMPLLAILWTVPTIGLLVTSFRSREAAASTGWWTSLWEGGWTLDNYAQVLGDPSISGSLINSIVVAVPATVLPIMFAAFAAYAFTFIKFPAKDVLFIVIVALMVVPIQVAFQPMLDLLGPRGLGINGQFVAVWMLHTGFGMPLAVYILRNYMATLPHSVVESAKIDGASHFQTFWRLVAPMSSPAIAAFATLQFLWVWNDLLIAKLFLGGGENKTVIVSLQQMLGTQGQGTELLTAGAFVSMVIPMLVFFGLLGFLVRGLTAGAVRGSPADPRRGGGARGRPAPSVVVRCSADHHGSPCLSAPPGHLTDPAARPPMMRRWKISTMMISGTVTITPAAIFVPYGVSNCEMPVNFEIATFAVCISGAFTIVSAMRNSFHAAMKVMIAVVNTPGAASGRMTLRNAPKRVVPSIIAACSSSTGSCRKNALRFHTASGSANEIVGRIIAW